MSRRWVSSEAFVLIPVLGLLTLSLSGGDLVAQSTQRERFTLGTGTIAIYNLAGELTVEPGSGSAVVVEVLRGGDDASQLRVETGPKDGMHTLRVLYPKDRVVYPAMGFGSRSSVDVAPDGTFGNDHGLGWLTGKRRITVSGRGGGIEAWANVRVAVPRGQKLRLHWVAGSVKIGAVEGDVFLDNHSGPVDVHGVKGLLSIDTGSGEVSVRNIQGDLTVDTGSGNVEIESVRGGHMSLDTGSGTVRATNVTVDKLVADTGSGGIELDDVHAPVVLLDTGSGHVNLDLSSDVETLEVDTGSGGVTVTVPNRIGAEFDIETGSGGIDVDVPHETISIERDHVRGRIGDGRGRIHVDTGSGGVRLLRRTTTSDRSGAVLGYHLVPQIG